MSSGAIWVVVAATAVGCYLFKFVGLALPARVLDRPAVARAADLLPVALLAALIMVQTFGDGRAVTLDARAAGLAAAAVAVVLRAPFLIVVVAATLTAAVVRSLAG